MSERVEEERWTLPEVNKGVTELAIILSSMISSSSSNSTMIFL